MGKGRILVADDDKLNLEIVCRELEDSGFEVFGAMAPREIFEITQREKPDILFIDLVMQESNGVETCRKIKETAPESEVVFVSGLPKEIERYLMDFIKAGGRDEYLRKPLLGGEITLVAEKIMEEKKGGFDEK